MSALIESPKNSTVTGVTVTATNLVTNPRFDSTAGTVTTPEGQKPQVAGVPEGNALVWQSTSRQLHGHSAAIEWFELSPEDAYPDAFYPDTQYPAE